MLFFMFIFLIASVQQNFPVEKDGIFIQEQEIKQQEKKAFFKSPFQWVKKNRLVCLLVVIILVLLLFLFRDLKLFIDLNYRFNKQRQENWFLRMHLIKFIIKLRENRSIGDAIIDETLNGKLWIMNCLKPEEERVRESCEKTFDFFVRETGRQKRQH